MKEHTLQITRLIEQHGWAVIKVPEDDEGPGFAYTVGLFQNYQHPEVILFGLDLEAMHTILNTMGEEVHTGQRFTASTRSSDFLANYDCMFRAVGPQHYSEFLGAAIRHYGTEEFPALQLVWPDKNGSFPWERAFDKAWLDVQPMLDPDLSMKEA